jgi:hypothetical protein
MGALTRNQLECDFLNRHIGETVLVLTSGYTANVAPRAIAEAVGYAPSQALRGLAARGYIKIEDAFWKGAKVTVLRQIGA